MNCVDCAVKTMQKWVIAAISEFVRIALFAFLFAIPTLAQANAKARHALVVGIANYDNNSGLDGRISAENDAGVIRSALENLRHKFSVSLLSHEETKDLVSFNDALTKFLATVQPGDDVLFYFGGYGYHYSSTLNDGTLVSNYYLLSNGRSMSAFLSGLSNAERQSLVTVERQERAYADWLKSVALSEDQIIDAINSKSPGVLIVIADASRGSINVPNIDIGPVLPSERYQGIFRLYSTSAGQITLESPEPVQFVDPEGKPVIKGIATAGQQPIYSLFTRALLRELYDPGLEISILAAKVKIAVRSQARSRGMVQVPDFNQFWGGDDFYFSPADDRKELAQICETAEAELAQLRYGVGLNSIARDTLMQKYTELARCGREISEELRRLLRTEAQGVGVLANSLSRSPDAADPNDPIRFCEVNGASPRDLDKPQEIQGVDLQRIALAVTAGDSAVEAAERSLSEVIKACEASVAERPLVARYKFNLARTYYALASITTGLGRSVNLARASGYYELAVDMSYAAAYNDLALMHQNGEYYEIIGDAAHPRPPDRDLATQLLQQGADFNDVVAQYNLGMAYKNGDSSLRIREEKSREALAFRNFEMSAERGYVPAMVEAAKAMHTGTGTPEHRRRAIDLLESAANEGSWEAMHYLGEIYRIGKDAAPEIAISWHARAADAGNVASQQIVAGMLMRGEGVPSPQIEAAGRYLRLAAGSGSEAAMVQLADLLRQSKLPSRPLASGRPDRGAHEIKNLYLSAFARGNPRAGIELAKLYRTGWPVKKGSFAIPKDLKEAIRLLWSTINSVRRTQERDGPNADPKLEVWAAFELIDIYEAREAGGDSEAPFITLEEVERLRADYGKKDRLYWVRASAIGPVRCGESWEANNPWILIWDWTREEPPTEAQIQWWERRYKCKENEQKRAVKLGRKEPSIDQVGFTKKLRDRIADEYVRSKQAGSIPFTERIAGIVSPLSVGNK